MTTIIARFFPKPGIDPQRHEAPARSTDLPTVQWAGDDERRIGRRLCRGT
jgi:hypothetical protein